jgi:hypothetical protein
MTNAAQTAEQLPLLYKVVVPLDSGRHDKLRLRNPRSFAYAATTALVPALAEEFPRLSNHYPIVFRQQEKPVPVILLGVRPGENLYVETDGRWRDRTPVPSYVQRYPFILAETESTEQFALAFDPTGEMLSPEGELALFEGKEPTPTLNEILRLCSAMKAQGDVTQAFVDALVEQGLLIDQRVELVVGANRISLTGFSVIDERKFVAMPDAVWLDWKAKGWIGLVYAHLLSLDRLAYLAGIAEDRAKS